MKKDSIETMQKIAKQKGGQCLSVLYTDGKTKLRWRCKNGHEWENTSSHIKQGQWCRECSGLKKLTLEQMQILAKSKDGFCISNEYKNIDSKLEWRCKEGHIWKASPYSIKNGTWCPFCSKRAPLTLSELQDIAVSRGGKLLSKIYVNSKSKLLWQCSKDHKWEATPYSVRSLKTWCPICAGNVVKNISELQSVALSRGGKCLSKKYSNVDAKYDWECSLGHKFKNSFNKVSHGQWCPICSKSGISEEICRVTFQEIFNTEFIKTRPAWLKNSRGYQMEIDGYSEKLSIGFEYHGRQHFEKTGIYTKSDEILNQRKQDDILKEKFCSDHGIKLFILTHRMNYWEFPKEIERQYKNFKLNLPNIDFSKNISINNAYIRRDRLIELRELLKSKHIELLSNKWLGTNEKYKLRCLVCNSIWEARGNAFFNKRRVSGCDYCNRRVPANTGSMQDVIDFANKFDGRVISTKYIGRRADYKFECKNDHKFTKNFNNMKFRNQWCPVCEGRRKRKID